jgi:hypothetical protein
LKSPLNRRETKITFKQSAFHFTFKWHISIDGDSDSSPRSRPPCAVQCSAVQCSAVQCSAVQCSAVQCSAVQCSAVHCSAVQCSAVQCSAVQCSAVQCSAVQCSAVQCSRRSRSFTLMCIVVQCSAVQCSAVQCSEVQCSAVQCSAEWGETAPINQLCGDTACQRGDIFSYILDILGYSGVTASLSILYAHNSYTN